MKREEVEELAMLARLELSPEEIERLRGELTRILGYVEQLAACDTTGVEPMTHAVPMDCPMREDVPGESLPVEAALGGAARHDDERFEVPRVVDKAGAGGDAG